ncbi:MAG: hypothetical protein AAF298_15500 [Cyanobacteria bacterium P01_A01_bin.40]
MNNLAQKISVIHTLGPSGTNCEIAAHEWFARQNLQGKVCLHPTLETAAAKIEDEDSAALMGCVVYPQLHTLVFSNLKRLSLIDCFVFPTHNMVLASRNGKVPKSISTHPAPQELARSRQAELRLVNSNSQAAIDCADGITDACITTLRAAKANQLQILEDFGPVPMGYTIHVVKNNNERKNNF